MRIAGKMSYEEMKRRRRWAMERHLKRAFGLKQIPDKRAMHVGGAAMKSWTLITVAFLWFTTPSLLPVRTEAAELRVVSTHAFLEVLTALTPTFENETGYKVTFGLDPSNIIKRQIEAGTPFDIAIVTRAVLDDLIKQGKIAPETQTVLASSGLGLVVRKGAPKPDISTEEGFKQALLGANRLSDQLRVRAASTSRA